MIWLTSIGIRVSGVGFGLAMRTEGTVSVQDRLVGWEGDTIATVLLEGVRGGSEG